jgi:hypothetical protein
MLCILHYRNHIQCVVFGLTRYSIADIKLLNPLVQTYRFTKGFTDSPVAPRTRVYLLCIEHPSNQIWYVLIDVRSPPTGCWSIQNRNHNWTLTPKRPLLVLLVPLECSWIFCHLQSSDQTWWGMIQRDIAKKGLVKHVCQGTPLTTDLAYIVGGYTHITSVDCVSRWTSESRMVLNHYHDLVFNRHRRIPSPYLTRRGQVYMSHCSTRMILTSESTWSFKPTSTYSLLSRVRTELRPRQTFNHGPAEWVGACCRTLLPWSHWSRLVSLDSKPRPPLHRWLVGGLLLQLYSLLPGVKLLLPIQWSGQPSTLRQTTNVLLTSWWGIPCMWPNIVVVWKDLKAIRGPCSRSLSGGCSI